MLTLRENALKVLEARYLRRDERGRVAETPEQLFRRIARHVAGAERRYGGRGAVGEWDEAFFDVLSSLDFLPNSPTLMNAGASGGQLSACFVQPVEDDPGRIFDTVKLAALIQQSGGGTGYSFSRLRPADDPLVSTWGSTPGPVSFMRVFDCATG